MMSYFSNCISPFFPQNGQRYRANGFPRVCYLPDSPRGQKVKYHYLTSKIKLTRGGGGGGGRYNERVITVGIGWVLLAKRY